MFGWRRDLCWVDFLRGSGWRYRRLGDWRLWRRKIGPLRCRRAFIRTGLSDAIRPVHEVTLCDGLWHWSSSLLRLVIFPHSIPSDGATSSFHRLLLFHKTILKLINSLSFLRSTGHIQGSFATQNVTFEFVRGDIVASLGLFKPAKHIFELRLLLRSIILRHFSFSQIRSEVNDW